MAEVIGVRFKDVGKVYYFDPVGTQAAKGDLVVVETARGVECGTVASPNHTVDDSKVVKPLKPIIRAANEKDIMQLEENKKKQKEAFTVCNQKIAKHKLDMKLVEVEYTFDNSKAIFYYTADERVDFRALVKDLAATFRIRIEMRQIGVRDESKMLGGIAVCGRQFCCSSYLGEFYPVSIKMAKEQNLSLNPIKISGNCGRLMCCLRYEQEAYEYLLKITPRQGSLVSTREGNGTVVETNLLTGILKVALNNSSEGMPLASFHRDEVKPLRDNRAKKQ